MLKTYAYLFSIVLALWFCGAQAQSASNPPANDSYGAAATRGVHVFKAAYAKSEAEARGDALGQCRAKAVRVGQCTVLFAFKNQCAVVMSHVRTDRLYWHISEPGVGVADTELQGLKNCFAEAGSVCETDYAWCSTHADHERTKKTEEFFDLLSGEPGKTPSK